MTQAVFETMLYFYPAIATSIVVLLFSRRSGDFNKEIAYYFRFAALGVLALCLFDCLEMLFQVQNGVTHFSMARVVFSMLAYMTRPFIAYIIFRLIQREMNEKIKLIYTIPILVNTAIQLLMLFTHWVVWFDEDNLFHTGFLYPSSFIVGGFYLLLIVVYTFLDYKYRDRVENYIIIIIAINSVLGTLFTVLVSYDFIQATAIILNVALYYMYLHSKQNNTDSLTGVLIRRRYYIDVEGYKKVLSGVILLDLNGLKQINDKEGHLAGDQYILRCTKAVNSVANYKSRLYRMGGDEFSILCIKMSENEIKYLIARLEAKFDEENVSCAIGYSFFNPNVGIDAATKEADEVMYANKAEMKEAIKKKHERELERQSNK